MGGPSPPAEPKGPSRVSGGIGAAPVQIAPSLLSSDFCRLADEIARVEGGGADLLHVDVMDGHFVANLTIGPPVVKAIRGCARVPLDVHVMIEHPLEHAGAFAAAGSDILTFHLEAADDPGATAERIRELGMRVGMALNPGTPVERVVPWLERLDLVLVMSVWPGKAGQAFLPEVLDKIRILRRDHGFAGDIEIDGGIGPETVGLAARAGANVFVAGSAVYGSDDPAGAIREIRAAALAARSEV